jgi:hypothetical protein
MGNDLQRDQLRGQEKSTKEVSVLKQTQLRMNNGKRYVQEKEAER